MCKNRAECESELEESRNGYWVIDAQMATSERDSAGNTWEGSVGIPAFYLHENVQGILTEDHAKKNRSANSKSS